MKLRVTLASFSRALAFSRAKTQRDMNGVAQNDSVQQPLSFNGVGLKYLTTAAAKEVEFATAKTSVWWDFENCMAPKGCDANAIAQNIKSVLLKSNYFGPITIYAYGDTNRIPSSVQQALSPTALSLIQVPPGVKDGSDKKILVDMLLWAMENKAPANIMLISGDKDFAYVLHQLGMKKYNILLAGPEHSSPSLIAAAKTAWLWSSIVAAGSDDSASKIPKQAQPSETSQWFCEKCNVTCTSLVDFNSHLSGKNHKKKCTNIVVGVTKPKAKPKSFRCKLCKVHCPNKAMYESHISGRKHKNKLKSESGCS